MSFRELTTFGRVAPHRYAGRFAADWYQGRGAFGGLVSASMLRAMIDEVGDAGRQPHSFTVHFCGPATEGELEIETRIEREGKYVSHVSARLGRGGELFAMAMATFGRSRGEPMRIEPAPMPVVPGPEQVAVVPFMPMMPPFVTHFEYRYCLGSPPFSSAKEARLGGWSRFQEPFVPDAPAIAALLDCWPPAIFAALDGMRLSASVDLTCHFLEPFPLVDARPGDFYLFEHHTPSMSDGFAEEFGALWRRDGTLLARVRQMVTMF